MSQVTLGQIQEDLTNHMVVERKELMKLIKQPVEAEKYMSSVPGVTDKYKSYTGNVGQVLQPYQAQWTPTGGEAIDPMIASVFMIKIDKQFDNLEQMMQTYAGWLTDEGLTMEEYPIAKWIIAELMEKAQEEIELNCATAQYVAPTPGTPGPTNTMFDGFLTVMQREITNSSIITTPSGSFTPADIYDNFSYFIKQLPSHIVRRLIRQGQPFFMSETNATHLWEDYRDLNGQKLDYSRAVQEDGTIEILIGTYRVKVKGLAAMDGSNRFFGLEKSNFRRLYDKIVIPNQFRMGYLKRQLFIEGLFKRGYAFERGEEVWCNDQE